MKPSRAMLASFLLLLCASAVLAHYNLKDPMPYNRIDCNRPDCAGPCPPIWKSGGAKARNSPANPSRVWKRGQIVDIEWHRNNHEGGFYRRSLVPVKYMNDRNWHKKTAFEYGCWTQGRYYCGKSEACGTDKRGFAYRNKMEVPKVFPDGDYVFSMVWYGGLHFLRKRAFFSDYYTCAYVKIQGGPTSNEHTPKFVPGVNHLSQVPPGKCVSTSLFVNECGGRPCHGHPVRTSVPGVFLNGRTPAKVFWKDVSGGASPFNPADLKTAPTRGEKAAINRNNQKKKEDAGMVNDPKPPVVLQTKKGAPQVKPKPKPTWKKRSNNWWRRRSNSKPKIKYAKNKWEARYCPPAPVGSWGPRNSKLWWDQRAKWWNRWNCCGHRRLCKM